MTTFIYTRILSAIAAVFMTAASLLAQTKIPAIKIDRIYAFGDSYSDIGRGWLDSDGPTAIAVLAKDLGLTIVASDKPHAPTDSLDFASSGASTGESPGRAVPKGWLGVGMKNQVEEFTAMSRNGLHFTPSSTLFFLAGGLNDRHIPSTEVVSNLEAEIESLYALGARRFSVALLPEKIPAYSEVATHLNPALRAIPAEMQSRHPDISIASGNWGPYFDDVMEHAAQFGITDTTTQCAGRAIFNEDATPCASPSTHFYYHRAHPSAAVHKLVGDRIFTDLTTSKPAT